MLQPPQWARLLVMFAPPPPPYLDSPTTAQKPRQVLDRLRRGPEVDDALAPLTEQA